MCVCVCVCVFLILCPVCCPNILGGLPINVGILGIISDGIWPCHRSWKNILYTTTETYSLCRDTLVMSTNLRTQKHQFLSFTLSNIHRIKVQCVWQKVKGQIVYEHGHHSEDNDIHIGIKLYLCTHLYTFASEPLCWKAARRQYPSKHWPLTATFMISVKRSGIHSSQPSF